MKTAKIAQNQQRMQCVCFYVCVCVNTTYEYYEYCEYLWILQQQQQLGNEGSVNSINSVQIEFSVLF